MTDGIHVALNSHLLSGGAGFRRAGVHRYIDGLVRHLGRLDNGLRLTVLAGRTVDVPAAGYTVVRSRWATEHAPVRILWEQVAQPRLLRQIGADLLHGPVYVGPLAGDCPLVVTIHDLSFLRYPELLRPSSRLYLTVMTRLSARRAVRLIAVSKHTAAEAASLLGIGPDRIDVVYHGVDEAFRPLPREDVDAFRTRRGLPDRFVLYVGTLEPRKNLLRLVDAYGQIRGEASALVLAGGEGWGVLGLRARVADLGLTGKVVFFGYVADNELPLLYNAASVFAYPSLYEGFGLPVVEALACGTPVLTAGSSSLPEAAGEAAIVVDPLDTNDIASGLASLLADSSLREHLRARGHAHARKFTWMATAERTARVYRRAVAGGSAT
jgi:glycosyltransferase involved in cell wall biosynthesis